MTMKSVHLSKLRYTFEHYTFELSNKNVSTKRFLYLVLLLVYVSFRP